MFFFSGGEGTTTTFSREGGGGRTTTTWGMLEFKKFRVRRGTTTPGLPRTGNNNYFLKGVGAEGEEQQLPGAGWGSKFKVRGGTTTPTSNLGRAEGNYLGGWSSKFRVRGGTTTSTRKLGF